MRTILLTLGLLVLVGTASVEAEITNAGVRNVGEFVSTDGSVDIESVRLSGYQGNLDLEGFEAGFDPVTGEPVFRPTDTRAVEDHPDDIYWDNSISPSIPGVNGEISALTVYGGKLIVGGYFSIAGGAAASCVAAWDGSTWSQLGSGMNYGDVLALTVYDGKLIAGGYFQTAGGVLVNRIASWDGSSWSPLGSGMGGTEDSHVSTLIVYDGKLIAGGDFTTAGGVAANYIASWDGSSWSPLGSGMGGAYPSVEALTVYDGNLITGGSFTTAGGVAANYISSWDGSNWSPLGSGMNSTVKSLTVYNGSLIAGGHFNTAGGVAVNVIASWDGSSWSPLESEGFNAVGVEALTVYDGKLIAGSDFMPEDGVRANFIASWDGSSWSHLGSGIDEYVHALTVYDGKLIAGGDFTRAGGVVANYLASWDGSSWSHLGSGMNSLVYALTVYDGKLIAGGNFTSAGDAAANGVGSWDGGTWSPLGSGINYEVYALIVYDGKLIAGGVFSHAGGVAAFGIASWDGSSWSPLGTGMNAVYALTVYDGKLIAGGYFSTAGGVVADNIASWDGSSWSSMGSVAGGEWSSVYDLTVYDGELIAGGYFSTAGGVAANNIASWNGSSWSPLGSGMNYSVGPMTVYDGELIAGGSFSTAGGVAANYIASWDGSSWSPLGSGMSGGVSVLTVYDGRLIAGGSFTAAGGVAASRIASWDGSSWSCLGSGTSGSVAALSEYDGDLTVGGSFLTAGNQVSAYLAQWDPSYVSQIVYLLSPTDGAVVTDPLVTFDWTNAGAVAGYVLEYSTDPGFPATSSQTVHLELSAMSEHTVNLPNQAANIYWRVRVVSGGTTGPWSETWHFDYSPPVPEEITSVVNLSPIPGRHIPFGYAWTPYARLTSTYTGPIAGNWLVDGVPWAAINESVVADKGRLLMGPDLPTQDPGPHELAVEITSPNSISSVPTTYHVDYPDFGFCDHLVVTATPSKLSPDGVSTSLIRITMVDVEGRRVWDNGGFTEPQMANLVLTGTGSLPEQATFTEGVATATYTAGTEEGTETITVWAWNSSLQIVTQAVNVDLLPGADINLAEHDFASSYLTDLHMDMMPQDFMMYNYAVEPYCFDFESADAFVDERIRDVEPTLDDLEAFHRLVLAEKLLYLGYRHNPDNGHPIEYPEFIGGAQELKYAAVENTLAAVGSAVGLCVIFKSAATKAADKIFAGYFMKVVLGGLDGLWAEFEKVLKKIADALGDREMANAVDKVGNLISAKIHILLGNGTATMTKIMETPIVVSYVTAETLGGADGYARSLQPGFEDAVVWAANHSSIGSLQSARSGVEAQLAEIAEHSKDVLDGVDEIEEQYALDLDAMATALDDIREDLTSFDNWVQLSTAFLDAYGCVMGTQKLVFGADAAKNAFDGYARNRDLIAEGIPLAFGSPGSAKLADELAADRPVYPVAEGFRSHVSAAAEQITAATSLYGSLAARAGEMAGARDTSGAEALIDSLLLAIDQTQKSHSLLRASVIAARDTALMVVPNFESQMTTMDSLGTKSSLRMWQSALGFAVFVQEPTDSTFAANAVGLLDSSMQAVQVASSQLLSLRETLFMVGAKPALIVEDAGSPKSADRAEAVTFDYRLINGGSGTATGVVAHFEVDSLVTLTGADSVVLSPVAPGDTLTVSFSGVTTSEIVGEGLIALSARRLWVSSDNAIARNHSANLAISMGCCIPPTVGDIDQSGGVDITDVSVLIDNQFLTLAPLVCETEGDVDYSGVVDITDLSVMIDNQFLTLTPLPECP